ncbi:unnamed protein product, partial [Amoebophrya sp. A25]
DWTLFQSSGPPVCGLADVFSFLSENFGVCVVDPATKYGGLVDHPQASKKYPLATYVATDCRRRLYKFLGQQEAD